MRRRNTNFAGFPSGASKSMPAGDRPRASSGRTTPSTAACGIATSSPTPVAARSSRSSTASRANRLRPVSRDPSARRRRLADPGDQRPQYARGRADDSEPGKKCKDVVLRHVRVVAGLGPGRGRVRFSVWGLVVAALCVALNGFFVAAEFALVKVRATQLRSRARKGDKKAIVAETIVGRLDRYLSVTQ